MAQTVEDSSDSSFGFTAATEVFEDMLKAGIIVPTKVERVALQNAASIASLLLTTECAIVDVKEKKKAGGLFTASSNVRTLSGRFPIS